MDTRLAIKSFKNACLNVVNTRSIILHSDLETQYKSNKFQDYISKKRIIHSFNRKGNPYDNDCIKSFHSILKKEEVNHYKYYNFNVTSKAIFEYIEPCYNRKRIYGSIGYITPQEVHLGYSIAA